MHDAWMPGEPAAVAEASVPELQGALQRAQWQLAVLARSALLARSGVMELRPDGTVLTLSPALQVLLGRPEQAALQPGDAQLRTLAWVPEAERGLVAHLWRGAVLGEPFEFEHGVVCADGQALRVLHRGLLLQPPTPGEPPMGIALLQDITERRDAERRIRELASLDEVTGLSNRQHLLHQIDTAAHAARRSGVGFSLLSLEVPRVAELGLTMGLGASDALATTMAARLRELLGPQPAVAHLGRGEFAVVLRRPRDARAATGDDDVGASAARLQQALQQPVVLGAVTVFPLCRIGIASCPVDGDQGHALLVAAQAARQQAPAGGGVAQYSAQAGERARQDLQLEARLRLALQRQEFHLVYQPQVGLTTGHIVGAEALLRWQPADCDEVPAEAFIPVAERTGLIAAIGNWVLHEACAQIVRWRQAGLPPLRVAVNLSPVQLQLGDVAEGVRQALAATGAPASALGLELTEAGLALDTARLRETLLALQATGIQIALDDFGSGASSLGSLRRLPIGLVKIHRSFVREITSSPDSALLTRSIIHLAHDLQLPVLAMGVETEGQLAALVAEGCDQLQGYLFSPPVPAAELTALLQQGRRLHQHLAPQAGAGRTLLLVDDEPHILAALKRLFRRDGYRVLTAASGAEGLEQLALHPVDVILSDQRMPGMTGVDFLRRTKALHPHTVRMTLSGFTDLQSIIDAVNEGAVYK
ncbi:MAG: hypothetical protein CFE45_03250, partial [Burkholderiales bacterium PBB5]